MIKMLNMKERIVSTAGTYMPLSDKDLSLAMMEYSSKDPLGIISADLSVSPVYGFPDTLSVHFRESTRDQYGAVSDPGVFTVRLFCCVGMSVRDQTYAARLGK